MNMSAQSLRDLHQPPALLVLPNAWDAGSARLIESLGAKAIATTSAGVAWARGYPDGNALPTEELLSAAREIRRVIRVPLSVDVEAGYSDDPRSVARLTARLLAGGASGINIEDGADPPELLCRKIKAVRKQAVGAKADLFINVRTDVYLRGLSSGAAAIEEVLRRASLYRSAGCDGLFVPGLADAGAMTAIAEAIAPLPLNVMVVPGLPTLEVLRKSGVRRLSAGSAIAQSALGLTSRLAADFLQGQLTGLFAAPAPYGQINKLFASESTRDS
jgi:2-methylisocitrate lyase-like PEP mutase family enzyme